MPPLRPPRRLPPSRARGGRGAPAARVAAAVLLTCAVAGATAPPAAAAPRWQRPVPGAVTRAFDYAGDPFAAGRHRGVDFAVRAGAPVHSACSGRVAFAGVAGSNGTTVSVRCGAFRVAYLPLRTLAVRRGARVARGTVLGTTAAPGRHAGQHVGVRREGSRWDYVDPLPFFGASGGPPLAPAPRRGPHRGAPAAPGAAPVRPPLRVPSARPLAAPHSWPVPTAPKRQPAARLGETLAPWPAWVGLVLILAGASGAGVARRRGAAHPRPAATLARVARE